MATYLAIGPAAMPRPTKTPFFAGLSDEPITEFLADYGELADGHKLTNKQKVETILRYVPHSLRDLWRSLPGFASGNWTVFSAELEKLYPDLDAEMHYSRQGLIDLVNLSARTQMRDKKDVLDYYRRFLAISNPLRAANLISDDERNAGFFHSFHPYDRTSLANWLYPLHPNRPRNKPYSLNDVLSVARVYFADLHLFRPVQHPDDHAQSAYPTRWPHQPLQGDHDTRWYDREPAPYQRDRNFPRDRCKASPSVGLETIHIWHSRYRIGLPTISDSDSHDVAPLYLSIDRSSHLALTTHTHTHTHSLSLSLSPHLVICYLLIHPHVAMDTTDRLASL